MLRIMRLILAFTCGLALAGFAAGWVRAVPGVWGSINVGVLAVIIAIFFFSFENALMLSLGIGLGFDFGSAYPFFSWTLIVLATAFVGRVIFGRYITNRSLVALLALGIALHICMLVTQFLVSRISAAIFKTAYLLPSWEMVFMNLKTIGLEIVFLFALFIVYVRVRGRSAAIIK